MRIPFLRALVVSAALLFVQGAQGANEFSTDIGGDWHFRFSGNRGAAILHFPGTPQFGQFEVKGAGYTTLFPEQAFAVDTDTVQKLHFDSRRNISGTLTLDDPTRSNVLGTLTIVRGSLSAAKNRVVLKGALTLGAKAGVNVTLIGERFVTPEVALTGRTVDGRITGAGVRSAKYDLRLYDERSGAPGMPSELQEGFPFVILRSGGPVRVDGTESAGFAIDGLLVVDAHGVVCGRVISSDFGAGALRGKLSMDPALNGPVFSASVITENGRRVKVSGALAPF